MIYIDFHDVCVPPTSCMNYYLPKFSFCWPIDFFNINVPSDQYRNSHYKDHTATPVTGMLVFVLKQIPVPMKSHENQHHLTNDCPESGNGQWAVWESIAMIIWCLSLLVPALHSFSLYFRNGTHGIFNSASGNQRICHQCSLMVTNSSLSIFCFQPWFFINV